MRLNTSNPTLFSLSCLFALTSALPLSLRDVPELVPRATYSVVPVDGGADATPGSGGDTPQLVSTIIKTETSPPKTVVETSKVTLPPVTSTEIVPGPDRTQTITGAPSPTTVTATGYSIINVSSPPVTIEVPAPVPSSSEKTSAAPTTTSIESTSSPTSSPAETTPVETSSEQSATPTSPPSSTSAETSTLSSSSLATLSTASVTGSSSESIPTTTATPQASSSSFSYSTTSSDNGQWHTTYPAWSNSTRTAIPDSAQATSSIATILPTSTEAVSTPVVRSEGGVKLNKRTEYMPKGQLLAHQAVQKRDRNTKRTPENKAQWSINRFFM